MLWFNLFIYFLISILFFTILNFYIMKYNYLNKFFNNKNLIYFNWSW